MIIVTIIYFLSLATDRQSLDFYRSPVASNLHDHDILVRLVGSGYIYIYIYIYIYASGVL
jgi:hypothetical protein